MRSFIKKLSSLVLLLTFIITAVNAADESYIQSISGKIKKGDSCTVIDDKFLNLPLDQWNLIRNLSVNNFITFELRQDTSIYYYNKPFTCTLNFSVKYFTTRDQLTPTEIKNLSLVVKYDTATGKFYSLYDKYSFKNAYKVTVVVNSISSPELGNELPAIFRIKNQILVQRKYPFSKDIKASIGLSLPGNETSGGAVTSRVNPGTPADNYLTVAWDANDFTNFPGGFGAPEEYDVEWTYIDGLNPDRATPFAGNTVTQAQVEDFMRFDNTRVTITGTNYKIILAYPDGYIVFRVRGAWFDDINNIRLTTDWQYKNSSDQIAFVSITHFEQNLNWQYTISFAEEGKSKAVSSFFDGSLRNRQAVTITNSENIAIVAETIYDNMGRPAMSILPTPVNENKIKYYPSLNKNQAGNAYSHADISNASGSNCSIGADGLNTSSGAAQYYSPNNVFIGDQNYYFTKYVPDSRGGDGLGYPFALTEYTPDNTGRIRRQGGVGPDFKIGSGHETNYFYGKPLQSELDRLFGVEVGNASHYLKNMVIDPNGQVSVSYVDAAGKTIATALAGKAPGNVDELPSALAPDARKTMTQILMRPADFQSNTSALLKEASATFLAAVKGLFKVHYTVSPAALGPWNGPIQGQQFCSNCYYDIEVIVKNDCGAVVASTTSTPFQINSTTCSPNAQPITQTLDVNVDKLGEHTVTYRLRLSEDVIKFQTDYYIANNIDLKKLQWFLEQELFQADLSGCYSDCQSCKLLTDGGVIAFKQKAQDLLQKIRDEKFPAATYPGLDVNSGPIDLWLGEEYLRIEAKCSTISTNCVSSPCEQKLELMKHDVRPGGQYALYSQDPNTLLYSITDDGTNVLKLYNTGITEIDNLTYDDNGVTKHIKENGVYISESKLIEEYLKHSEWADAFVKQHIEYCSYLWCKDASNPTPAYNNEVSYTFDENLRENIIKGQDAVNAGFYNQSNYLQLSNVDPFFNGGRGSTYKTQLQNDLGILSNVLKIRFKDQSGNWLPAKNIQQLIEWMLYCKPPNTATNPQDYVDSWTTCSPTSNCRSLTSEWELYRNYYLKIKSKYVRLAKLAYDPDCENCFIGQDPFAASICYDPGPNSDYTFIPIAGPPRIWTFKLVYKNGTLPFGGNYKVNFNYQTNCGLQQEEVTTKKGEFYAIVKLTDCIDGAVTIVNTITVTCINGIPQQQCDSTAGGNFTCPVLSDFSITQGTDGFGHNTIVVDYLGSQAPFPPGVTVSFSYVGDFTYGPEPFAFNISNSTGDWIYVYPENLLYVDYDSPSIYCSGTPPPPSTLPPSTCGDDPRAPLYANKIRIFNDYIDEEGYLNCLAANAPAPTTQAEFDAQTAASIQAMRNEAIVNLDAMKQNWLDRLRAVKDEENANDIANNLPERFASITDPMIINLVNNLYLVAQKYIEIAPASNIRPASTLPLNVLVGNNYNNFSDVFNDIIGSSLVQKGFGPHLLDNPYPFDKTPVLLNPNVSSIVNTDICLKVAAMKTRWNGAGNPGTFHSYLQQELKEDYKLTSDELTDLENRCTNNCKLLNEPLILPGVFAPSITTNNNYFEWKTCSEINDLYTSFQNVYPLVTVNTKLYRNLLTNFMNSSLGYALSFDDYDDFKNTICVTDPTAVLYAKPASPSISFDLVLTCLDNIFRNVFDKAGQEYQLYIETERIKFRNAYISKCLSTNASAKLEGEQYEYHYTLYYYDQSGNLVKTIPPEGVALLSDSDLQLVEDYRNEENAVCSAECISPSENATAVFNAMSDELETNTARSIEMWLNSEGASAERQVRIITPDNKYFYQVAIKDGKLWAEMYSLQPNSANDIDITLSAQAVADISANHSLQSWTHVVVQSTTSLTGGELQLYYDGIKLTNLTSNIPAYPFEWDITAGTSNYTLPQQDIATLKHYRIYNRVATDAEVLAEYKNSCLSPVGALASYTNNGGPLALWGRFNIPTASTITVPNKGALQLLSSAPATSNEGYIPSVSNNFTMELWVNPEETIDLPGESTSGYAGVTGQKYAIFPRVGPQTPGTESSAGISVGTNGINVAEHSYDYLPVLLSWSGSISGWTHIAVVYQNKQPKLYVNGQLVKTGLTSLRTAIYPSTSFNGGSYGTMKGFIDEVRIWNSALSQSQIAANMNTAVLPNSAGLSGYWPMSPCDNNIVQDITGNGHHSALITNNWQWVTTGAPVTAQETIEYASHFIVPDHTLPTTYAYNSLSQVIKQTSPDGGTSEFYYDRLGRLMISQNEEQKTPKIVDAENPANRYSYTKYDALGRITVVGEKVNPSSTVTEDLVRSFPVDGHPDENDPYYTSNSNALLTWFGSGTNRQVTVTAYDVQPAWVPASLTGTQKNLRKRVVASAILSTAANNPNPAQNRISASYYSYDLIGNVNVLIQENTALATAETGSNGLKTMKYQYDLASGKVNRVLYQDGKWDQFYYAYLYDADIRVVSAWTSRTNIGNPSDGNSEWVKEATYRYYLHGPLARVELSRQKVQGVDYAYTLQGWLKGVNSQKLDAAKDMSGDGLSASQFSTVARDVYGFSLGYFNKNASCSVDPNASDLNLDGNDYKPIGGTGANAFDLQYQDPCYDRHNEVRNFETGKNLFNGNIGNATYAIKQLENGSTVGYTYRYDQLNRITGMRRNNIGAGATTWDNTTIIEAYKEEISYDANGNIKTYLRNGNQANNYGMDNMTYNYNVNGSGRLVNNKLRHVDDAVADGIYPDEDIDDQNPDSYQYDNIGNLISDNGLVSNNAENLQRINWTVYGKISTITKVSGSVISYTYDATGNRISKTVTAAGGSSVVTTYYVRDAQGNVMGLYTKDATTHKWVEQHLYGNNRLGMATPDLVYNGNQAYASSGDPLASGNVGKRIYELSNHLGNVLVTINDISTGFPDGHKEATVLSANDYYPFGMLQPGRKYSAGSGYRYGFNGQEKETEIDESTTSAEFWMYDSRIGRRWNPDPLFSQYSSRYAVLNNNPIIYNDFRGDTARIKWGGLGNKYNISYVGGKWIDTKTRVEYGVSDATPNRVKRQMEDYHTLHSVVGLENMLEAINSTTKNIYLRSDEGKTDLWQLYNKKQMGEDITNADISVGSSGSRFSRELQMNEEAVELPSYVTLAHELGHVYDYLFNEKNFTGDRKGFKNFIEKYQTQDPGVAAEDRIVAWSEIAAMCYENIARVHANISPRQFYGSNRGVPEFEGLAGIGQENYELVKLRTGASRVYRNVRFWDTNGNSVTLLVPLGLLEPANKGKRR